MLLYLLLVDIIDMLYLFVIPRAVLSTSGTGRITTRVEKANICIITQSGYAGIFIKRDIASIYFRKNKRISFCAVEIVGVGRKIVGSRAR